MDQNPFKDVSILVKAMETNVFLKECTIGEEWEYEQSRINYYTRLNEGGRRLVMPPSLGSPIFIVSMYVVVVVVGSLLPL